MDSGEKQSYSDKYIDRVSRRIVGAILEPAWLYADLGENFEKNPLESLTEAVAQYHCRGAVVHLGDVPSIYSLGCRKIIPVIDFPYGRGGITGKKKEVRRANDDGVISVDTVINLWLLQEKRWKELENELKIVSKICRGKEIKAICQMPFVWQYHRDAIPHLLYSLAQSGIWVIKDWTTINNFSKPIETSTETRVEYVKFIRRIIDEDKLPLKIKVAGGVNVENVVAFKKAGADIFGIGLQKLPSIFETLVNYFKKK